jgi:L-alanine-DL-glutamate epimerase-like enolase superfamily enzyme
MRRTLSQPRRKREGSNSVRVTRLRTALAHVPFTPPIDGGPIMLRSAGCVLVFLETDDGAIGEGVAFVLNNVRIKVIHELILSLEPLIVGTDVAASSEFTQRAWRDLTFIGHAGVSIIGLSAVECALWDLRAKAANLNVAHMLGALRTAVPIYHSGGLWISRDIDALQREAGDFVSRGYRAMKMRLGRYPVEIEVARVRAVREAIGPDIALMADINQQLTVEQAIRLGRQLEEFKLTWLEEPVHYLDHAGEAAVAAALNTPIASGETEYTSRGMQEMLRLHSADILMPDLQRMGGPGELIKAAKLAEAQGVPISPHLFPEMSLSLVAAISNGSYLEYMPWLEPLYRERIVLDKAGCAVVPDRPGWGFSFDPAAVKSFAVAA